MNWTLQLLSHNLVFLFHLIPLGKLTSIPLPNMHLKTSLSSPEPAGFFSSSHLLTIYKSQIRPSLEYCSHVWDGAPKSTLCLLDKVQCKSIRLINNPNLTALISLVTETERFQYKSLSQGFLISFLPDKSLKKVNLLWPKT